MMSEDQCVILLRYSSWAARGGSTNGRCVFSSCLQSVQKLSLCVLSWLRPQQLEWPWICLLNSPEPSPTSSAHFASARPTVGETWSLSRCCSTTRASWTLWPRTVWWTSSPGCRWTWWQTPLCCLLCCCVKSWSLVGWLVDEVSADNWLIQADMTTWGRLANKSRHICLYCRVAKKRKKLALYLVKFFSVLGKDL